MTRRMLVYQESGLVYSSQEFNGDRSEALQIHGRTNIGADWEEIVDMFEGVPSTLKDFRAAVEKSETAFAYEHEPLIASDKMPYEEEVWLFVNGKLSLHSKYGEIV